MTGLGSYEKERGIFTEFGSGIRQQDHILAEFVGACAAVNIRYDTAIFENRFIVGGVVEQLVGAAMRAVGIRIDNIAKTSRGVDLISRDHECGFSVKSQFKKGQEIRLTNTMGRSGAEAKWDHPTIFVIAGVGVGYADPELVSTGLVSRSDALVLRLNALYELWDESPRYLIPCAIHAKPNASGMSRVASDVVAQDILIEFKNLLIHYQPER